MLQVSETEFDDLVAQALDQRRATFGMSRVAVVWSR